MWQIGIVVFLGLFICSLLLWKAQKAAARNGSEANEWRDAYLKKVKEVNDLKKLLSFQPVKERAIREFGGSGLMSQDYLSSDADDGRVLAKERDLKYRYGKRDFVLSLLVDLLILSVGMTSLWCLLHGRGVEALVLLAVGLLVYWQTPWSVMRRLQHGFRV